MSSHPSYYPRANHHPASSSSGGNSNSGVQTSSSGRMALIASTIGGAGYAFNNGDDKDTGNGFEFTRRKRWPHLLLQELVGSALFCLKPIALQRDSIAENGSGPGWGWKIIFVSPSVGDMLGQKASDLENREFFDLVFTPDHPQLQTLFSALISPHAPLTHQPNSNSTITTSSSDDPNTSAMPSSTGRSHTAYVRMLPSEVEPGKDKGPVVWELRAHATGLDGGSANGAGSFGLAGSGTVVPRGSGDTGNAKGRAVWVMGRKIGEGIGEGEGKGQSLDAFLELKLENERLREELRELQLDMDEYEELQMRSNEPPPRLPQTYHPDLSSDDPDSSSASTSSASSSSPPLRYLTNVKPDISRPKPAKPGRPPKDPAAREKKRLKKASMGAAGGEREGLHVCVTCGRTDSPEWRKGPLGPKTLCNACGLRWAKRNSTQPTRKERKAAAEKKGQ